MKRFTIFGAALALAAAAGAMGVDYNGEAAMRSQGTGSHMVAAALVILAGICYFLPTIIALLRRKIIDLPMIFLVNTTLGWTVIGWGFAFAWSMGHRSRRDQLPREIRHA